MGRLVRLEVENFKSYKGRQTIGPFHNFTSVIGPNGSGKSNLMDAISFVLGVKSSQLRSSQLKDLIYHTGQTQDEAGALPKRAYVMAVYEKADEEELKFTRTVTGTGSSEYKINNKVVTYAEYSKALEKENILIKARNFLVFQGDVETIASQQPKDLTRLIEQISGSLDLKAEYDRLKEEQEKATETSAHNFNKKRGITAEMKQFREQKEEAERYENLLQQRDGVIMHHLLWKLYHIDQNIETLEAELTVLENELKAAKKQQAKTNKELMRHEKRLKDKSKEMDERKPELLKKEERLKHSNRKLTTAEENLAQTQKELARQTKSVESLEKDRSKLQKASDNYEESVRERSANQGPALDEAALAEYNAQKEDVGSKTFAEKQEWTNLQRQVKIDTDKKSRLEEELKNAQARESSISDDQSVLETRKRKVRHSSVTGTKLVPHCAQIQITEEVEELTEELNKARQELQTSEAEHRRLQQTENEMNERLMDIQNKLTMARVDRSESERETRFKETLDTLRRIYPGVHGRMFDLIKPTQQKYNLAVSTILGKNMDSVVVDTERTAIDCIQYMREQRSGHATFLPLDNLVVKPIAEKFRNYVKGARLAIDVIQYDDQYQRALEYACNNALVCDTNEIARHIVYEKRQEVKAVSLDGTIIHKTGMITGGTYGDGPKGARRWEEKEIDSMRKTRDLLVTQVSELSRQKRALPHDDLIRDKINKLEAALRNKRDDLTTTNRKLEGREKELQHLGEEIERLTSEIRQLETALTDAQRRMDAADAKIKEVENGVFAAFCRRIGVANIREYEDRHMKVTQEVANRRMEYTTQIARVDQQIQFEQQRASETAERIAKLEAAIKTDRKAVKELEKERKAFEESSAELQSEIEKIQEDIDALKEELEQKNEDVTKAKKEVSKLNKEIEGRNKAISAKESEIEKHCAERFSIFRRCRLEEIDLPLEDGVIADITLEEIEEALGADTEDVDNETSQSQSQSRERLKGIAVDFSELKKDEQQDGSTEMDARFQDKIKSMTSDIEKMAPNMRAVDKLGEVETKLRATAEEFDNARKEAKSAKDAFNSVKQRRYDTFYDAYTHIAEKISSIYKDLTKSKVFPTGGQAYLNLEDSEEPYNSGVKFHAMPPGKRFREMEQLSGGEKTVAALALLFAIHSYQPAPFFVLDEVDAALDNTNVAKVAEYIRRNASESFQFIVISLKNTFYERAEALVGIYRDQDEGSSKCLTLQLEGKFEE
ncbi:Structural maintenance of chromosomes protein 1 [Rhizophlyctis rosea]|nr:Structural maintenance of chromosomes protein 1 [Rhizophlyctis rosea]